MIQEITREERDRQYVTGQRQTLNHMIEICDELYQKLETYKKIPVFLKTKLKKKLKRSEMNEAMGLYLIIPHGLLTLSLVAGCRAIIGSVLMDVTKK